MPIRAYAATAPKGRLEAFEYEPGPLPPEFVEVQVEHCGLCHSDLSMVNNDWGNARYPLVPGHEAIGRVVAVGPEAKRVKVGDRVVQGQVLCIIEAMKIFNEITAERAGTIKEIKVGNAEPVEFGQTLFEEPLVTVELEFD